MATRTPVKPPTKMTKTESSGNAWVLSANSMPFMLFTYLILSTVIIGCMVAYYFWSTSGYLDTVWLIGIWLVVRGFPTVIKRWFGKPIPTDRPYMHAVRLYFILLVTLIPYLIVFSDLYYDLGHKYANECTNIAMTKMSSLYFATTTFSTTGFGDIHAVTPTCQAWVTVQMISGFIIISIIIASFISRLIQLVSN